MSDFVLIKMTTEAYETLKRIAANKWSEEEHDEMYESSVTCGNADDTFADGETQGEASLAAKFLEGEVSFL